MKPKPNLKRRARREAARKARIARAVERKNRIELNEAFARAANPEGNVQQRALYAALFRISEPSL